MSFIPKIAKDTDPSLLRYLEGQAPKLEGKTIKKVVVGIREHNEDSHESDVLQLEFTDGSTLFIQTGSNAQNVADDVNAGRMSNMKPDAFHADFVLTWVDAPSNE